MERSFDAAVFDMDGLLLDSERVYGACWMETARHQGVPLTQEMVHATIGMNAKVSRAYLMEQLGPDFDFDTFYDESRFMTYQRLDDEGVPLKPYALEILEDLKAAGWRMALATSTREHVARHLMEARDMMKYFDAVCFGSQVERGKPFPDVFLLAARDLGTDPARCVVLEDSPNGITAARAAGMVALWVPDQILPAERPDTAREAHRIFPSLREASRWLLEEGEKE